MIILFVFFFGCLIGAAITVFWYEVIGGIRQIKITASPEADGKDEITNDQSDDRPSSKKSQGEF